MEPLLWASWAIAGNPNITYAPGDIVDTSGNAAAGATVGTTDVFPPTFTAQHTSLTTTVVTFNEPIAGGTRVVDLPGRAVVRSTHGIQGERREIRGLSQPGRRRTGEHETHDHRSHHGLLAT